MGEHVKKAANAITKCRNAFPRVGSCLRCRTVSMFPFVEALLSVREVEAASMLRAKCQTDRLPVPVRRLALGLLKQHRGKGSIACKQLASALNTDFLEEILCAGNNLGNE